MYLLSVCVFICMILTTIYCQEKDDATPTKTNLRDNSMFYSRSFQCNAPIWCWVQEHTETIWFCLWIKYLFISIRFSSTNASAAVACDHMMTSSNGNIFRVTGHLCGEFIGDRWIPRTKASEYLNKRLSKQSRRWWFKTPSRPWWRHSNKDVEFYHPNRQERVW